MRNASLAWVTEFFRVRTASAMAPDLLDVAATWKPDVLVCEPTEFGACLAGEILVQFQRTAWGMRASDRHETANLCARVESW